jgi:CheY-like chemotaxis protein
MLEESLKTIHALVVDDEAFSQRFVTRVLATLGITQVTLAENGIKAIEAMQVSDSKLDIVISDIEMPEMNGFELVRKIRWGAAPQYKDIPILMLTGQDSEENVQKGKAYRIQGFIIKPPKPEILKEHIIRALGLVTTSPG